MHVYVCVSDSILVLLGLFNVPLTMQHWKREEEKKMPTNRYACVTVPVCKFHAKHSEISMSLLFTAVLCRRSCMCSKTWI